MWTDNNILNCQSFESQPVRRESGDKKVRPLYCALCSHVSSYTVTRRHVLSLKPTALCCRLVSPEITFRGSSCLVFSFHIRGSETGYLTVYVTHGADTTVVFREGLYSHDTWQTARVMVHTNDTFQVDTRGTPTDWQDTKLHIVMGQ